MSQLITAETALRDDQRRSLADQIARLGPGEPWTAVRASDGTVCARARGACPGP